MEGLLALVWRVSIPVIAIVGLALASIWPPYPTASAATIVIQPSAADGEDSWIEYLSDANHGNDTVLETYASGGVGGHFTLIRFNLSSIPSGKVINSATLTLTTSSEQLPPNHDPADLAVHRITSSWSESTVNWNNQPSIDSQAASVYSNPPLSGQLDFNVTALVGGWYTGSVANHGLRLGYVTLSDYSQHYFVSSDDAAASPRPKLTVSYSDAPPSPSPTPTANPSATPTPTSSPTPSPAVKGGNIESCLGLTIAPSTGPQTLSLRFSTSKKVAATLYWDTVSHTAPPGAKLKAKINSYPAGNIVAGPLTTDHVLTINNLNPATDYFISLTLSDGRQDCEMRLTTLALDTASPSPTPSVAGRLPPGSKHPSQSRWKQFVDWFTGGIAPNATTQTAAWLSAGTIAAVGVPAVNGLAAMIQFIASLPYAALGNWLGLLTAFRLRKKRYPWGRTLDAATGKPIHRALVTIHHQDRYGRIAGRAITDTDGRFGFIVEPGHYTLRANKPGYTYPSDIALGAYRGKTFGVGRERMVVVDLFLDPSSAHGRFGRTLRHAASLLEITRLPILGFGSLLAVVAVVGHSSPLSYALALLYCALWAREIRALSRSRRVFRLTDQHGKPLPFTVFRLAAASGRFVSSYATDTHGEAFVLVPAGRYTLEIVRPNRIYRQTVDLPQGILWKRLEIKPADGSKPSSRLDGVESPAAPSP